MAKPHPTRADLTAEYVRSLLDYNCETGVFLWRERSIETFSCERHLAEHKSATWNAQHAGRVAGGERARGYLIIRINRSAYRAHRLAWLYVHGEWPDGEIDHINGDGLDNRIANLRIATRSQNIANCRIPRRNTSGFKGVSRHTSTQRWHARITVAGKQHYLGLFDTPEAAHAAYMAAARHHHGKFARAE